MASSIANALPQAVGVRELFSFLINAVECVYAAPALSILVHTAKNVCCSLPSCRSGTAEGAAVGHPQSVWCVFCLSRTRLTVFACLPIHFPHAAAPSCFPLCPRALPAWHSSLSAFTHRVPRCLSSQACSSTSGTQSSCSKIVGCRGRWYGPHG